MSKADEPETGELVEKTENREDDAFEAMYNNWLVLRSDSGKNESDEERTERIGQANDLAKQVCFTPVVRGWQIFRKIEVLEYNLQMEAEAGQFEDNRCIPMLAAVKADLLRFRIVAE